MNKKYDDIFSHQDTIYEHDGQTEVGRLFHALMTVGKEIQSDTAVTTMFMQFICM